VKNIPVIIDCDPGNDDAIALMLALSPFQGAGASKKLDVKAVTVCHGNVGVDKTLANAKRILRLLNRHVPLAAGAAKPLLREAISAENIHGKTGLEGAELPPPDYIEDPLGAIKLMHRIICESSEPVTLIATGPLTNIALLFAAFPEVKKNIALVSFMGGSADQGNWTAAAEFNFYADPEAADMVLSSGLPLLMSGLNVTQKALIMQDEIETLRSLGGPVPAAAAGLLNFYLGAYLQRGYAGAALHDPCAVACLTNPELFSSRAYPVMVETRGTHTLGMSLVDMRPWTTAKPNVTVNMEVDRKGLIKLLTDALGRL
jgi:pyrimidine-specific ribonucleoside hydrolase